MLYKSPIITAASGKLNGLVASHNRGGPYMRTHVIPTDPHTDRQVNCRDALNACWARWSGELSQDDRNRWEEYATRTRTPNRIGDQRHISGWAEYCRQKFLGFQANEQLGYNFAIGASPPVYAQPFSIAPFATIPAGGTDLRVNWSVTEWPALDDHAALLIYVSTPQPATINYYRGPYRLLNGIPGDPDDPPGSPQDLTLPEVVASGLRVFYKIRFWGDDFIASPPWYGSAVSP